MIHLHVALASLVIGIAVGLLYGLIALAVVVLYKSTGIANFAQGNMATFTAFIVYFSAKAGIPLVLAIGIGICGAVALGAVTYLVAIAPNSSAGTVNITIRTLAVYLLLAAVMNRFWAESQPFVFPKLYPSGNIDVSSVAIPWASIGEILAGAVVICALGAFFYRTRAGLLMRGLAEQRDIALLLGVNTRWMTMLAWMIASVAGLVVGSLTADSTLLSTDMMDLVLLYAFASAIIGGLTSIGGAIVGGLFVGIIATFASVYLNQDMSQYLVFLAMLLVLLKRPEGLFGIRVLQRL